MENVVVSRQREEPGSLVSEKFLVMRTLARLHDCDEETILDNVDATQHQVHGILRDMVSKNEVEANPAQRSRGLRKLTFTLTLNGWGEYMQALGSIYELPE
jgi:hypothetical protein